MPYPKVTVVGAGHVGATAAHLLLVKALADVVLVDVADGLPQGKALDMMHSRSVERFGPRATGANDYSACAGSDVVVVTAGVPRKPGMTREELAGINARIVRSVMAEAVPASPDAVFVIVTNPLDVMTDLAWRLSGLPPERVIGMGGVLDSARFAYYIAQETGVDVAEIDALCCGMHGEAMVPLPRHSFVAGRPLTEVLTPERIEEVVRRSVAGGAEVVGLLKTGSAYYAPASSIVAMVEAVLGDTGAVLPSCVLLTGEYGIDGVHMSVPASLGRDGVRSIPVLDLDEAELSALRASAETIRGQLAAAGV
ncbi:MAG: malate dehydrogenase [Coriobacteriaceae bacterium]|nr:malate dehydrogenase [Coriobacteriaceae bacterium]